MDVNPQPIRVALTGAAGFLGRTLASHLAKHFPLRTLDKRTSEGPWEIMQGDVGDLDVALRLCEGCSHLVIAHMAPNRPDIYGDPTIPFDVNVKGAANLFHAASVHGIQRTVLISSTSVVAGHMAAGQFLSRDLPDFPVGLYSLTKTLQEGIARYYHDQYGMEVAVLRPAHICDEDRLVDKYDKPLTYANWVMIDPRDIAEAVRLSLVVRGLSYDTFYISGHPDAEERLDLKHTRDVLGWKPRHTFEKYPREVPAVA
jgi:nucleoside-diphosphate-sugar epimerase